MNVSAEKGKEIKSQRARELEELRSKGVAKTRREKLKDCKWDYLHERACLFTR